MLAPHPPLENYYGDASKREGFVRTIFDDTAPWYDQTISFMSFGSGDRYRREAVLRNGLKPGMTMLDVASGTGVVARAALEATKNDVDVVALDPSIGMLRAGRTGVDKVQAKAESLPMASNHFDFLTIGFALRHFADLRGVFDECRRVLKPRGRPPLADQGRHGVHADFSELRRHLHPVRGDPLGRASAARRQGAGVRFPLRDLVRGDGAGAGAAAARVPADPDRPAAAAAGRGYGRRAEYSLKTPSSTWRFTSSKPASPSACTIASGRTQVRIVSQ